MAELLYTATLPLPTPWGKALVILGGEKRAPRLLEIQLPTTLAACHCRSDALSLSAIKGECRGMAQSLATALAAILVGKKPIWSLEWLEWGKASPFTRKVSLTLAQKVSPGRVISYGVLATLSGAKGAARAVGSVMASNRFPLLIPCHRVVRSDRHPGAFAGGNTMTPFKRALLEREGIRFDSKGKILSEFFL